MQPVTEYDIENVPFYGEFLKDILDHYPGIADQTVLTIKEYFPYFAVLFRGEIDGEIIKVLLVV